MTSKWKEENRYRQSFSSLLTEMCLRQRKWRRGHSHVFLSLFCYLSFSSSFYASWLDVELKASNEGDAFLACLSVSARRVAKDFSLGSLRIEYPKENRIAFDFQRGNDIPLSIDAHWLSKDRSVGWPVPKYLSSLSLSLACPGIFIDNLTPSSVGACL